MTLIKRRTLGALAALLLAGTIVAPAFAQDSPVQGGTLIYLEQQAHTNLYPPAGGFYPNGGVLNQITDKLTYQNPETLEIEPWLAKIVGDQRHRHRVHLQAEAGHHLLGRHAARRQGSGAELRHFRARQ